MRTFNHHAICDRPGEKGKRSNTHAHTCVCQRKNYATHTCASPYCFPCVALARRAWQRCAIDLEFQFSMCVPSVDRRAKCIFGTQQSVPKQILTRSHLSHTCVMNVSRNRRGKKTRTHLSSKYEYRFVAKTSDETGWDHSLSRKQWLNIIMHRYFKRTIFACLSYINLILQGR